MFRIPGDADTLTDEQAHAWSAVVSEIVDEQIGLCPQFFDPQPNAGGDVVEKAMRWTAFPRKLSRKPREERFRVGEDRDEQEEYCEWVSIRDASGKLIRAIFTTETSRYYKFLAENARPLLLNIYQHATGLSVEESDLLDPGGIYDPNNRLNRTFAIHMTQQFNTLSAAVILAAQSSVVRTDAEGVVIEGTGDLIDCGINADRERNSDPFIVTNVNSLARSGARISLLEPIGLYIDSLQTSGWETEDQIDPIAFWKVTRGAEGHAIRAVFETPEGHDYKIGDIKIDGFPLTSASQIAEHILIRLTGIASGIDSGETVPRPCARTGDGLESLESDSAFPTRTGV